MKTLLPAMTTHLAEECTTLCMLWKIVRPDGTVYVFTNHDVDVLFGSETYKAATGFQASAISNNSTMNVSNLDMMALFDDDAITEQDLRNGLFDYAEIFVSVVNWADPDTCGQVRARRGRLGECMSTPEGYFKTELRGMTQTLLQRTGQICCAECRADLGDSRCKVPIDPPLRQDSTAYALGDFIKVPTGTGTTYSRYQFRIYECTAAGTSDSSQPAYDTTLGNTTTDGTAVFTARTAWTRPFTVASVVSRSEITITVTEPRSTDPTWFQYGSVLFETGDNLGKGMEVKTWDPDTGTVTLMLSLPFLPQVGDVGRINAGCNKLPEQCKAVSLGGRFGNMDNYRGEQFVPGLDTYMWYPDPGGSTA